MKQSRGIRNNNPGNIDYNKNNQWRGQIGIETSHEFDVYNEHAEACRQWGREQKALLGL